VAKETRPRVIKILMQMEGKDLRLQVEHDGDGAGDTGGDPPGFALFSLRERLDRIGGTVAVQAPPGRDTVITLIVPLRRDLA
jgi:signal transduction histidine kinase